MKTNLLPQSRIALSLAAFLLIFAALSSMAQPAQVIVNVFLWNESDTPNESQYIVGQGSLNATPPAILTTNLSFEEPDSSAYINCVSAIGQLQLEANSFIDRGGEAFGGDMQVFFENNVGGPDVEFLDQLTVTSPTLPVGTPVQIQLAALYSGFISPPAGEYDFSSASVELGALVGNDWNYTTGLVSGAVSTNLITYNVSTYVGSSVNFSSGINAEGGSEVGSFDPYESSISAGITNVVYVSILTPGASYTTASEFVYPTLLPTLTIQPAGGGMLLTWPVTGLNFALQQNSDLTTTNWLACNSPVTTANGTNQVTISPALGNMFYRLASQ